MPVKAARGVFDEVQELEPLRLLTGPSHTDMGLIGKGSSSANAQICERGGVTCIIRVAFKVVEQLGAAERYGRTLVVTLLSSCPPNRRRVGVTWCCVAWGT